MPFEPPPVERVSERIVRIPIPLPFFDVPINVYVLLGKEPAVIDTGPLTEASWGYLMEQVSALGLAPRDLRHIVITHGHVDHHGLLGRIHAESGAKVWVHERDAPGVFEFHAQIEEKAPAYRAIFGFWGLGEQVIGMLEGMRERFFALADTVPRSSYEAFTDEVPTAQLGPDTTLRVLSCPGHTEGLVCLLWEEGPGWFFSGDHVLETITPNPALYEPPFRGTRTGLGHYVQSLRDLRGTIDAGAVVLPGHGAPFGGLDARIDQIVDHHADRAEKIVTALRDGASSVLDVAFVIWPKLPMNQYYLACREAHGHLDILAAAGRVALATDDAGVGRWSVRQAS